MTVQASVVVLGYGAEPELERCLDAVVAQLGPDREVILLDNGVDRLDDRRPGWSRAIRLVRSGENLGFAGGCNAAALEARGDRLVFLNSDAILRPGALDRLLTALDDDRIGIACGCLRLADAPDLVNSVGNPLQFAGLTWAGECGAPAAEHSRPGRVAVATGGFFALRREVWDRLGGFDATYFAYHEDTDLSIRAWLAGLDVVVRPDAVADHHYEFSRNPRKMFLLERNRLVTVLTDYPRGLLCRTLPAVLLLEPAFLVLAALQGWPMEKLRSWWWLARHPRYLRRRRSTVQAAVTATRPSALLARLMIAPIDPPNVTQPPGMSAINAMLHGYWWLATRGLDAD
ncbi:Predicted glycosyltransferase [Nostocoides japonicum T1-X7]|uniref:Predicted glycosyltransferase n=1 Tax=Nostocoides japonicum T1-X7 TaxID=1194083 RepID=A0A077LZQ1_9MICO|nr:glycosyltransferase family 2 protein [Tetrasphaera japonica]CCH77450.1 Predicted glycosyltransferase [Tetrasphaera japonica T1-X7]